MKILGILLLAVVATTVKARHKQKEFKIVDVNKLKREHPQVFSYNKPVCNRGAGYYRHPQDCHQYVLCVDEFGTGRHFKVHVKRCEPGLVFDENASACNWPELAAPCSNSSERFQDPSKPDEIPNENSVSVEKSPNKPYQQLIQEIQISESEPFQQEVPEDKQQVFVEIQGPEEQQEQIYQESPDALEIQNQVYQEDAQSLDTQQELHQENIQEPLDQDGNYDQIIIDSKPEQVSLGEYQQTIDEENPSIQISQQVQQESQSEWWVPEDNIQHNPPERTEQIQTSTPSERPVFCSKDGFYRHPENCSQFIRCVEIEKGAFAVHFFECPKELVFDEKDSACIVADIQNCNYNIRKKRQATNTKLKCKGEGFFRHPVDCRAFYRCVKTEIGYETHHFSCPANLVFDEEYTTCNWPEKAPPCNTQEQYKPTRKPVKPQSSLTTNRRSSSTSKPSNDFIDKSITQETYSKRRYTEKPRTTVQSYRTSSKCQRPGFFRNENDCTKFHKCVKKGNRYIRYDLSCPQNFAYDDMSQKCVAQRYATSCKRDAPYPPRQDDEETSVAPETSSSSSSSSGSENNGACEKEGYFRNPEDCNKFYRCVDFDGSGNEFVRYDFNCPEGLVFDEENSVCNWPDQSAPCDTRGSGNQGNGKDTEIEDNEPAENESEENDERVSESEENEVATSFEPSTSQPIESTSSSSVEENEENGESTDQESNKESGNGGSDNECTKEGFYRNPDDCNKFYRCVDFDGEGKEFVRYDFSCPEGLVFDETNSVCNWPSDSEPCDTRSSGNNKESNGQDGSESTSSTTPGSDIESSDDNEDSSQKEQTTPSNNEVSESTSDDNSPSESSKDDSESSTDSSNKSTTGSRGSNGENSGECTEEGFFRNPEDCNKFYRCVDQNGNGQFVKYDFTCPEGLVFDESNSVCNWPDQSAPCDGESSKEGQGSTSESGGDGSESSQATTSSSSSASETSEENTESSSSSTTERPQTTDGGYTKSTTEESTDTSPDSGESTSDSSGSESGNNQGDCTEEGFFRNPEDCNKFYRCVDFNGDGQQFVRYDFECPEGLVFDEVNSVCNWPNQSPKCESKSGSGSNETSESGEETSTSATESSSEQSQSSTEQATESSSYAPTQESTERSTTEQSTSSSSSTSSDSSECSEPGFFRCKDDCNKFYRCVEEDGKLVRYDFKCPEGLIFDDKNKKCDWPSSTLTCEEDTSSTTSSYETSTSSTSSSTKSTTSSETSNKECTEEGFFRDPDDCSKYYRCTDEGDGTFKREDFACSEDEVFDEEMRYCNRKDLAPPCDESQTSQSQSTSSQTQTTAAGGSTSEGQTTTEKSTTTQASTEGSTKSSSSECTEPGFFRCPEDCTKFYRCVEEDGNGNLVRYDFQCPDGLIFDEKNKKCDWPSSELTCDTDSTTGSTTESSTTGSQTTASQGSTSQGTTSSGATASSNDCTEEGFFRNPDDCSKYYRCTDEGDGTFSREDFACEDDEVFDEEMRYCNRKDLAPPCDGSSTTQSSGSTRSQTSEEESGSSAGTTSSSTEESVTEGTSGTTSGSSASGECQEEGFHRDPNDCNKFYRCVDFRGDGQSFTRYDFDCPEGLVFDETNSVCNWPSSVPSCESGSESRGSTQGESSSTKSSKEDSSEATEASTASATSEEQKSTTSREQTSTTSREQTSTTATEQTSTVTSDSENTTENQDTPPGSNESSTSSDKGTTASGGTGSSSSGSSGNIECTEEGFFRHPEDCSKFYRCVDFAGTGESYVRYDFDCPEGLVFDEVNSVCNWPNMSPSCESGSRGGNGNNDSRSTDSGESSSTDSNSNSPSSASTDNSRTTRQSETSTSPRDQTTRSSTSTTSSEGEFRCEEEGFFKHPTDCKKYYECKHDEDTGELVKIDCECPDGQVWDNDGWYCNAEELSPPCEKDSSSSSFKCTEEGFFRDPEDCTRYYQCNKTGPGENDFSKEQHQCDDGLVFDEEGRYCNAPELSEPCDNSSSTSSGTTSSESSSGATNGDSSSGTNGSGSSAQVNCTSEGFFRNPEDCTKYYQCSRNEDSGEFDRSDHSCPDGRIFDEESSYCNEPELSEQPCDSDNNDQSSTTRQTNTQSSSSDGGSTSSTGARSGSPQCTEEGFFRHPDDCNKFYRCVDFAGTGESFVRYDFDCPEGLHFDEVNSVCNWPSMTPSCESSNRVFLSNRAV